MAILCNRLDAKFVFYMFLIILFGPKSWKLDTNTIEDRLVNRPNFLAEMSVGNNLSGVEVPLTAMRIARPKRDGPTLNIQYRKIIGLTRDIIFINLLILCNDVALNPGPVAVTQRDSCPVCLKMVAGKQACMQCLSCKRECHLQCLGIDYEIGKLCKLCSPYQDINGSLRSQDDEVILNGFDDIVKSRGFKLVHQNIRSLMGKINEVRIMVSQLRSGIHVLSFTETWLTKEIIDGEVDISGYSLFRKDRNQSKGGGVGVFVRNDIDVSRRYDLEIDDIEGIWLEITLPKSRAFLVGTFYRPPNSSNNHNKDFMKNMDNILELAVAEGREIILNGDFNCDLMINHKSNHESKQLKTIFRIQHFIQLIKEPTRIDRNSKTLLDLIATNCPQNIKCSGVISSHLSDHELVYCVRKLNGKITDASVQFKTFRNYAKYDSTKFCEDLKKIDWKLQNDSALRDSENEFDSVDGQWQYFKLNFLAVSDKHAPFIQKKIRSINNCPWMNTDIKKIIRERDYQHKKARRTNTDEDWNIYRRMRNKVTNKIRSVKSKYNIQLIEDNADNPKAFWKTVKRILPGEPKTLPTKICVNSEECINKFKIAEAFNQHFSRTVARLADALGRTLTWTGDYINKLRVHSTVDSSDLQFKFKEIEETFVYNQLCNIKTGKSCGLDNISPRLLKDAVEIITKPLTKIINTSLEQGSVPDDLKTARITPIFKSGNKQELDNYRPISVLPVVSKLLERAVHIQLYAHLSQNQLLNPYQCGFRKLHSTETAAISFVDTIRRNIDHGMMTGAVFIDLQKAFDTVNHKRLLHKLQDLGIINLELKWFEDYLHNRMQRVRYQNVLSDPNLIQTGVPQGSILGPLLFIVFINDMVKVTRNCNMLIYADDTVLFCSSKDSDEISKVLEENMELIDTWLSENILFLNKKKTECMLFGTSIRLSRVQNFSVSIKGSILNRVTEYMYLGIVIDEVLSWKEHVHHMLSKAGKRIGMLRRIRKDLTVFAADKVYKAFIRPTMEYCDTVWTGCGKTNGDALEKVQNRAARIVTKLQRSEEALKYLKWESLLYRRDKHVYNLVKRSLVGKTPQFLKDYFSFNYSTVQRITRQSYQLRFPKVKTECGKKGFFYYGCTVYNRFNSNI